MKTDSAQDPISVSYKNCYEKSGFVKLLRMSSRRFAQFGFVVKRLALVQKYLPETPKVTPKDVHLSRGLSQHLLKSWVVSALC